jgi:hypothetical protein
VIGVIGSRIWRMLVDATPLASFFGTLFAFIFLGRGDFCQLRYYRLPSCNLQAALGEPLTDCYDMLWLITSCCP